MLFIVVGNDKQFSESPFSHDDIDPAGDLFSKQLAMLK